MRISTEEAEKRLLNGEVVALPTDTVYGLATALVLPYAARKLFSIKNRSSGNPLIILVASSKKVTPFLDSSLFASSSESLPGFAALTSSFWPGALTLVLPVDLDRVPAAVRANLPTAGFRVPKQKLLLALLERVGPCVVTSANLSGARSPTTAEEVEATFGPSLPVLDGGPTEKARESTILAFNLETNGWKLLREGAISEEELELVIQQKLEKTADESL